MKQKAYVWRGTTKGSKSGDKVSRAIRGSRVGLTRDNQGHSEFCTGYNNEPVMIIDKEVGSVNHAHQDTWSGVKTFVHYRRRPQRRP